jgi:hypothetical protein
MVNMVSWVLVTRETSTNFFSSIPFSPSLPLSLSLSLSLDLQGEERCQYTRALSLFCRLIPTEMHFFRNKKLIHICCGLEHTMIIVENFWSVNNKVCSIRFKYKICSGFFSVGSQNHSVCWLASFFLLYLFVFCSHLKFTSTNLTQSLCDHLTSSLTHTFFNLWRCWAKCKTNLPVKVTSPLCVVIATLGFTLPLNWVEVLMAGVSL